MRCKTCRAELTRQYGIVSSTPHKERLERMRGVIEKPSPENARSTLAVSGRYVLSNRIFDYQERQGKGLGGEIQLTDAIAQLLQCEPVYAYLRYD